MPPPPPTGTSGSKDPPGSRGTPVSSRENPQKPTLPPGYEASSVQSASPSLSQRPNSDDQKRSRTSPSLPVRLWRTVKSIFFASTPAWQMLKSGALIFFGFFCWSASNLLLSYEPTWHWPYFFMSYGFLLVGVGPLTHLVLVPHVVPWLRRQARGTWLHTLGRHLIFTTLTLFFAAVLWMGIFPPSLMQINFQAATNPNAADIAPTLICSATRSSSGQSITCQFENTAGVGSITVETGQTRLLNKTKPPFTFSLQEKDLVEVVGERQFQVIVRDEEGAPVRRFSRRISTIR